MDFSTILNANNDETNTITSLIDCFFQNDNLIIESNNDSSLVNQFPQLKLNSNVESNLNDQSFNYSLQDIASEYLSNCKENCDLIIDIDKIKLTSNNQEVSKIIDSNTVLEKESNNKSVLIVPNFSTHKRSSNQFLKKESKVSSLLFKKIKVIVKKRSLKNDFDLKEQKKIVMMIRNQRKRLD
jgi:hypothetical protein